MGVKRYVKESSKWTKVVNLKNKGTKYMKVHPLKDKEWVSDPLLVTRRKIV